MRFEHAWQIEDEITAAVNAVGKTVWDLHYDTYADVFRLELEEHLSEDIIDNLCAQMALQADYEGEGDHGSRFTLTLPT